MTDNTPIVVGIGEVLWDILPDGRKLGGAPANFAYHVSQFGMQSLVVSAIGDDALGKQILTDFSAKGLRNIIATVPYPTGTVQVNIDSKGVPQYSITENVAWDNIPFTTELEHTAHCARAVCFGTLAQRSATTRATIHRFIDAMPQDDKALIVFDANLRQKYYDKETLECSMRRCNILKINDEELCTIIRMTDEPNNNLRQLSSQIISQYAAELIGRYELKMLILTCGVNGSYIFTPEATSFMPTPKVAVVDTIGAGDSFTAAFVACTLKGISIAEAHRTAVNISAYVCTQSGAMPQLPNGLLS